MKLQQHVCGNYFCPKFFSVVSFQLRTGRTWQLLWLNTTIFYLSEKSAHHCLRVFWALTNHEYDWYLLLDAATVKLCIAGSECSFATVGDAKAMDFSSIASLSAVKAEPSPLSQALTPSMATMSESIKSLQAQKLVCIPVYYGKWHILSSFNFL